MDGRMAECVEYSMNISTDKTLTSNFKGSLYKNGKRLGEGGTQTLTRDYLTIIATSLSRLYYRFLYIVNMRKDNIGTGSGRKGGLNVKCLGEGGTQTFD